MRALLLRRWPAIWGILLLTVLATALLHRHFACRALAAEIAGRLTPIAEHGSPVASADDWEDPELDLYLWGEYRNSQYTPALQGPAIYLINNGYTDPRLLRALLLTETRRCYDWQYTYARVRNHDLREGLIRRCLALYPDDLRVAWAAGQLELAAGNWFQAEEQLGRVVQAAGSMEKLRTFGDSVGRKGRNVLGRYCAALTFCGRDAEAGALLRDWQSREPDDRDLNWAFSHWLLDNGEYEAVLNLLGPSEDGWAHPTFDAPLVCEAAQAGLLASAPGQLEYRQSVWEELQASEPGEEADWELRDSHGEAQLACALPLARILLRYGRAAQAQNVLNQVDSYSLWDDPRLAELRGLEFLATIINGSALTEPAEDGAENPQRITSYSQPGGPFSDMLNSESGVALLRSPLFDAALRQRGVSAEEFRPQLNAAIRPERENYGGYYSGGLRAGAL